MKKLKLAQAWVDQVTSDDSSLNVIVAGTDPGQPPSAAEVTDLLNRAASADSVREMVRRKWFTPKTIGGDRQADRAKALQNFLFSQRRPAFALAAMYRRQHRQRNFVEEITTLAWLYRVAEKAAAMRKLRFDATKLNERAIANLVRLSKSHSGPRDAIDYLQALGIRVVIESSLPGMRTDGASFIIPNLGPVIGLTLRHDRLDSFWFTLLHELAHIALHLRERSEEVFVDSIEDDDDDDDVTESEIEAEANAYAKDSFVPRDAWLRSEAFRFGTEAAVLSLAKKFQVHPAVVAGRLRFERKKYQMFSQLLGAGEVRSILLSE